jgi:hypothetical protein
MSTATLTNPISDFATAVRAALSDLPTEEIDELTDGLEADLYEQSLESSDFVLGDPNVYAHELRAAAGLPARRVFSAPPLGRLGAGLGARWRQLRTQATASIRSHPFASHTLDFFVAVRPVWWLLRGWVVFKIFAAIVGGGDSDWAPFPHSFTGLVVLAISLLLSIQWGRGKWLPWVWLRVVLTIASVVAVFMLPVFIGQAGSYVAGASYYYDGADFDIPQGLQLNGTTVSNVFAYDANGQPLHDVQLFDQDGNPLNVAGDPSNTPWLYQGDGQNVVVPNQSAPGRVGWNVFPLGQLPSSMVGDARPDGFAYNPNLTPNPATPPFDSVPPLAQN